MRSHSPREVVNTIAPTRHRDVSNAGGTGFWRREPGDDTVQTILPTRCSEWYLGSEYTDQEETVLVVSTEADETEVVSNGAT